MHAHNKNT
jgi:hypothetical protein